MSSSRGEKKDLWVGIRLYAMGCNKFREKWQRGINPCRGFHLGMRSAGWSLPPELGGQPGVAGPYHRGWVQQPQPKKRVALERPHHDSAQHRSLHATPRDAAQIRCGSGSLEITPTFLLRPSNHPLPFPGQISAVCWACGAVGAIRLRVIQG